MSQASIETDADTPELVELTEHDIVEDTFGADATQAQKSFFERFLDSFFDERNIKWLLVAGAAVVFGSSLMLVTREWSTWPASVRFLTVLGYTAVGFVFAEVGRKRLGLKTTSKVLYVLTLLLMPLSFLSLSWLSAGTGSQSALAAVEVLGLMVPATAFLWFAGSRILDHLLNSRQTTFLVSYQLLSIAGVIPAVASPVPAFALMAALWLVFTAGVIKVNRHTFWLAEEHRLPRVFGFLPIAMLGMQFVTLAATKCLSAISVQWIGLGCVLVAATVLMTARTVADVFRRRTGDLVRPLPWNIVAPLFAGLVIAAAGVVLSFSGFSYVGPTTFAVIPTAVIAALLMGLVARDTKHPGFVWASLICVTIAYQCSPTLFADIVGQLKQTAADAINEQRLPVAFYGLTYLPFLATVAFGSRVMADRGELSLSRPMKHFVTCLSLLLFVTAVTHVKALFFVSVANIAAFAGLAILFRDRRYAIPLLVALVLATGSAIPCLNAMNVIDIDGRYLLTALAALAVTLTATGVMDRLLNRIPASSTGVSNRRAVSLLVRADGTDRNLCQIAGCLLAALLAVGWVGSALFQFGLPLQPFAITQFGFLLVAIGMFTLRNPRYLSGTTFWMFLALAMPAWFAGTGISDVSLIAGASIVAAVSSVSGWCLMTVPGGLSRAQSLHTLRANLWISLSSEFVRETHDGRERRVQAFVVPMCDLSLVVLSLLTVVFHLPNLITANLGMSELVMPVATTVSVLWLFVAGWCFRSRTSAAAGTMALPLLVTAVLPTVLSSGVPVAWYLIVWATVTGVVKLVASRVQTPNASIVGRVAEAWLIAVVGLSCLTFEWPARLAALIALGVTYLADRRLDAAGSTAVNTLEVSADRRRSRITWLAIAGNVQTLLLTAAMVGLNGFVAAAVPTDFALFAIPSVFVVSAASVILFDRYRAHCDITAATAWTTVLRASMVALAALSLTADSYMPIHHALMLVGFTILAVSEFVEAIRCQNEKRVWLSFTVALAAVFWLFMQDVIHFGVGVSQYVLLGTSMSALVAAKLCRREKTSFGIAVRPFETAGQIIPAAVAVMGFGREVLGRPSLWLGWNSLAMFGAAAVYFHLAIVTGRKRFGLLTGIIFNAALLLLWRALHFTDPQFYLVPIGLSVLGFVELMKKELPRRTHDPLRYAGALTILVSPMFNLLGGSWLHILSLMVFSVIVILMAIGLRLRVLIYTGSAFLLSDLIAMVVRSTIDHPSLLWICGVAFGAAVIALAAVCENHREKLLSRIRLLSAELATWESGSRHL